MLSNNNNNNNNAIDETIKNIITIHSMYETLFRFHMLKPGDAYKLEQEIVKNNVEKFKTHQKIIKENVFTHDIAYEKSLLPYFSELCYLIETAKKSGSSLSYQSYQNALFGDLSHHYQNASEAYSFEQELDNKMMLLANKKDTPMTAHELLQLYLFLTLSLEEVKKIDDASGLKGIAIMNSKPLHTFIEALDKAVENGANQFLAICQANDMYFQHMLKAMEAKGFSTGIAFNMQFKMRMHTLLGILRPKNLFDDRDLDTIKKLNQLETEIGRVPVDLSRRYYYQQMIGLMRRYIKSLLALDAGVKIQYDDFVENVIANSLKEMNKSGMVNIYISEFKNIMKVLIDGCPIAAPFEKKPKTISYSSFIKTLKKNTLTLFIGQPDAQDNLKRFYTLYITEILKKLSNAPLDPTLLKTMSESVENEMPFEVSKVESLKLIDLDSFTLSQLKDGMAIALLPHLYKEALLANQTIFSSITKNINTTVEAIVSNSTHDWATFIRNSIDVPTILINIINLAAEQTNLFPDKETFIRILDEQLMAAIYKTIFSTLNKKILDVLPEWSQKIALDMLSTSTLDPNEQVKVLAKIKEYTTIDRTPEQITTKVRSLNQNKVRLFIKKIEDEAIDFLGDSFYDLDSIIALIHNILKSRIATFIEPVIESDHVVNAPRKKSVTFFDKSRTRTFTLANPELITLDNLVEDLENSTLNTYNKNKDEKETTTDRNKCTVLMRLLNFIERLSNEAGLAFQQQGNDVQAALCKKISLVTQKLSVRLLSTPGNVDDIMKNYFQLLEAFDISNLKSFAAADEWEDIFQYNSDQLAQYCQTANKNTEHKPKW